MRRHLCTAVAALVAVLPAVVDAQAYPARPVRLIVPSSPGGGSDFLGRVLAQKLSELMGQQFVVENRAGASSMIGTELASKAPPDGYTLVLPPAAVAINPSIFARLNFDALRDLAPITQVVEAGNVLVAHPSVPANSVKELIALAKKRPGTLTVATPGISGTPHLAAELFRLMTSTELLIVVYKGSGPGTIALISGEVALQFATPPSSLPSIRAKRIRALGVTSKSRIAPLPDVPAIAEIVPGYEATQWFGLLAPAGTPRAIIDRLYQETSRAVRAPEVRDKLSVEGLEPVLSTPDAFAGLMRSEHDKWAKVIRAAGIKPQ